MFSLWKKKKKKLPENEQLRIVIDTLFPDYRTEMLSDGTYISVDESIDENLHGALTDLEMDNNDKVTRETISNAIKKLMKLRKLLNIQQEINPESKAIIFHLSREEEEVIECDES